MMFRFRRSTAGDRILRTPADAGSASETGTKTMRWETPKAIDFRFGMEITMYIANR